MNAVKRAVIGITTAALFAGFAPVTTATAAQSSGSSCWDVKGAERGFAKRINDVRGVAKRGQLRLDPELSRAARLHTREMAKQDKLYHTPSDKLSKRVTNWTILGENVGVGGDVQSLHEAFMASPAHADNVLYDSFRHMGVGVIKDGDRMWVTVIFEAETNPGTTLRMPNC
ncbi:MAG TPA: CAP domain-containing protein [Actinomycetota bacterium]|nr:CAP domain-containing protein [Actinomycetota bacterium]